MTEAVSEEYKALFKEFKHVVDCYKDAYELMQTMHKHCEHYKQLYFITQDFIDEQQLGVEFDNYLENYEEEKGEDLIK
ncbi:hypothetical protein [Evansella tamaricis]|uniref:Uncharacterized protein n=1 Tax=Evansella tamaricis TaxID=2069301 RepID=A0ABS6JQ06_9BACI|nr:hypothetical protein [Evansella tamaricis]MBU9714455.1 hypothetical protein [Evansella tamaricis]